MTPDREKVIKALESCTAKPLRRKSDKYVVSLDIRFVNTIIALLKEQEGQVQQWMKEIADNQLAHAPDELDRENWDYKKGIWDGLQIAWNIISEGR